MTRRRLAIATVLGGLALAAPVHAAAKPHDDAPKQTPAAEPALDAPGHLRGDRGGTAEAEPTTASRTPSAEPTLSEPATTSPSPNSAAARGKKAEKVAEETMAPTASRTPASPGSAAARQTDTATTPAATAAPAAPAAAPVPAAPTAKKPSPRRTTRGRTRGASRRRAQRRPVLASPTTARPAVTRAPVVRPKRVAETPRRTRTQPTVATPDEPRTLTRFVTRAIEVIPAPVQLALQGLAALAALLLAALLAAGFRARRLARQRRRLMADVGLLQSALLPELPPTVGRAHITAAYRPADGLAAGGDFYDAFALDDDTTCVILGDVAGHGRDAIPVTALVRYTIRAYLEGGMSPRQALQIAGRVLQPQLRETIVTVLVALYDAETGLLTVATAGHPPPVVTSDQAPTVLAFSSPALGLGAPTGRRQVTVPLPPGAAACFYTDGLADVCVEGGRIGLEGLATQIRGLLPEEGAEDLIDRLVRDSASQPDDMAALVIRPPSEAPNARVGRIEELEVDTHDVERGRLERYLAAYGVDGAVAEAATRAVSRALGRAHAVVIEINHDAAGATVSVIDSPDVVALPLAPQAEAADELRAVGIS